MQSTVPVVMTAMNNTDRTSEFVKLQTKYQNRVFSFVLTLAPRWSDAEEILQETNAVLWKKREQFEPGTDFVRWANQVAYFEVLKFRESRRRDAVCFSEVFIEDVAAETSSRSESLQAQREALELCLQKLPEKDRILISHRYREGAAVKTIAETVGRSLDAVYKALQRARGSLLACVRRTLIGEEQA